MSSNPLSKKIISFCNTIEPFAFYGFIFFVPISIAFSEVFASFTLFFFFVKRWTVFISSSHSLLQDKVFSSGKKARELVLGFCRIVKPEKSILSRPLGLFIFACGISVFFSQYAILSLQGFFFKVLQWTYLYFVFIEFMKEKKHLAIFIGVLCVSAGIVFANGIFQYFSGKDFIFGEAYVNRIFSSFRHANDFGAYLVLICPVILSLMFSQIFLEAKKSYNQIIQKVFFVILFLAGYFCLGMTFSRGAWFGFLAAVLFWVWNFSYRQKKIIFVGLLVVIIFFLMFLRPLNEKRKMSLISNTSNGSSVILKEMLSKNFSSAMVHIRCESDRFIYWSPAIKNLSMSPIIGSGINTYSKVASSNPAGTGGYPHNCYLQMAVEIGLLGLSIFLWVLFILFRSSFKNIRKIKDPFFASVTAGLLSGLFGFLVHSAFDTNFYSVQLGNLMWVVMGAIVAVQMIAMKSSEA